MNNSMKVWFLRTLAATLALLLLCTAVIVAADPFYYYRWDSDGEGVFFNQRYQDAGIARNCEAENVILGTSMVSNFRASYLTERFGGTAAKLTIPDGRFSEFDQVMETLFRSGSPRRVLFSLDLNILVRDESELGNELPLYLYDANPLNDLGYLVNKDALFYSVYALYAKAAGEAIPCDEAFTWDQDTGFSTNFVLASYTRPQPAETALERDAYSANVAENVSHVLAWAAAHPETEFVVYVPPYNILYWDKVARSGETEAVFGALQQAFEALLAAENVRLCQFLDLDIVTDCSYFNDYIHFSGLGAQRVLEAMESGEYDVTAENMADTLKRVRAFQESYDYEALLAKRADAAAGDDGAAEPAPADAPAETPNE